MDKKEILKIIETELHALPRRSPNSPAAPGPRPAGYPPIGPYSAIPFMHESNAAIQIAAALKNIVITDDMYIGAKRQRFISLMTQIKRFADHSGHSCTNQDAIRILELLGITKPEIN